MMAWLAAAILLQAPGPPVSEIALFNQIVDARPADRIKLGAAYEQKFPKSKYIGDVHSLMMDSYAAQNNAAKLLEYGEKTLRSKPGDIHALAVVARQLAVGGANMEKAALYARRAIESADQLKDAKPPANYTAQSWADYIRVNRSSADSTLQYIRQSTLNLLRKIGRAHV